MWSALTVTQSEPSSVSIFGSSPMESGELEGGGDTGAGHVGRNALNREQVASGDRDRMRIVRSLHGGAGNGAGQRRGRVPTIGARRQRISIHGEDQRISARGGRS